MEINVIHGCLFITHAPHLWLSFQFALRIHAHSLFDLKCLSLSLSCNYSYFWTTTLCLFGRFPVIDSRIPKCFPNENAKWNYRRSHIRHAHGAAKSHKLIAMPIGHAAGCRAEDAAAAQGLQGLLALAPLLDLLCPPHLTEILQFPHVHGMTQKIARNLTLSSKALWFL